MDEEIKYIPYGDTQIDYNQFMQNSANSVQNYINQQPWSKKRKQSFLNAYKDLVSRGITGASNTSGVWNINYNGSQIDLDSLSKTDKEMYGEAAYFIQQQMSGLPTKAKQATVTAKKDLPLFDNNYFTTQFQNHISNQLFGGRNYSTQEDWNVLDERGENGLRGTKNRANKLADMLQSYSDSLEEGKYNFEGTPFKDLSDFKSRVGNAITALRSEDPNDDKEALNRIGLNYNDYFYNGGNDPFNKDNYEGTYADYYNRYVPELRRNEQQELKLKQDQIRANKYTHYKYFGNRLNGKPLSQGKDLSYLNGLAQKANLNGDEMSEIVGAFKLAQRNGVLQNLSREELSRFNSTYANNPSRLKKINGLEGLYWDSIGNRVVQPYNTSNAPQVNFNDILQQNSPEYLAQQRKAQEEQRRIDAGNRKVNDGEWQTEDYLRMAAMGQDIAGTIAAFLPGYGTAASAGLGLTALGTNMAADIADDSVSKWDVAKNAGINLGLGVVGLIPGLGIAGKSGKWVAQVAKWAPRILTMAAAGQVALSDDIKASIAKLNSNETLTVNDWKNVGYALSTVAGVARGARGIVDHRKYSPAFRENTTTETYITTKSGKRVPATREQVEKINKAGRKGGNDRANEELRKLPGAQNEEVNIEFKTGIRGKADPRNRIQLQENTTSTTASPRVQAYQRALQIQNQQRKSGQGIYRFAPRFLPTSYDIYKGAATMQLPQTNLTERIKKAWNPVGESKKKPTTTTNQPTQISHIPKGVEENVVRTINNAYTPPEAKLRRQTRQITPKNSTSNEQLIDGSKYQVQYGRNNKQDEMFVVFNGKSIKLSGKTLEEQKQALGKWIQEQNNRISQQSNFKIKKDDTNWKEFVKSIQRLKRKGYLYKTGGQINLEKTISDFLNKNENKT